MAGIPLPREGRLGALPTFLWKTVKLLATVAVTFLGLLLVIAIGGKVVARGAKPTLAKDVPVKFAVPVPLWTNGLLNVTMEVPPVAFAWVPA